MARLVPQLHADAPEGYAIVIRLHTEPAWTVELYGPLGAWCILSGPRSTEEVVRRACACFFRTARPARVAADAAPKSVRRPRAVVLHLGRGRTEEIDRETLARIDAIARVRTMAEGRHVGREQVINELLLNAVAVLEQQHGRRSHLRLVQG